VAVTLDQYSADIPDLDQEAAESIGGLLFPVGDNAHVCSPD